jgi:type VI secretion system secreted protein Hcp
MKFAYTLIILGIVLMGFLQNDVHGANYIKFDGVDGETINQNHKGWSNLFSWSESPTTKDDSATARTRGDTTLGDIVIVKELDKSSPKLVEALITGKTFPKVLINLCSENDSNCYLSYELINVMINRYEFSTENQNFTEEISLTYEKISRDTVSDQQITEDLYDTKQNQENLESSDNLVKDNSAIQKPKVPKWVQTTATFWVGGNVTDIEFTNALGFLVKEKIIDVEVEKPFEIIDQLEEKKPQVPAWISQTTKWWIEGKVPEDQFLEGIKWMIKNKIIIGV